MARVKRETVDYFPHYVTSGKTMFILEQNYGNDGYAFWFKLLELIGNTDGHYIDCSEVTTWKFLQARMNLTEDICSSILDLLADIDAIDKELWESKIIWSDNFIKNIEGVYAKRRSEVPSRPVPAHKQNCAEKLPEEKFEKRTVPEETVHKNSNETYQKGIEVEVEDIEPEDIEILPEIHEKNISVYRNDSSEEFLYRKYEQNRIPARHMSISVPKKRQSKESRESRESRESIYTHGSQQNVRLTKSEYQKLLDDYPEEAKEAIELLSLWIKDRGDKSKSKTHDATIRRWVIDAVRERKSKQNRFYKPSNKSNIGNFPQRQYSSGYLDRISDFFAEPQLDYSGAAIGL